MKCYYFLFFFLDRGKENKVPQILVAPFSEAIYQPSRWQKDLKKINASDMEIPVFYSEICCKCLRSKGIQTRFSSREDPKSSLNISSRNITLTCFTIWFTIWECEKKFSHSMSSMLQEAAVSFSSRYAKINVARQIHILELWKGKGTGISSPFLFQRWQGWLIFYKTSHCTLYAGVNILNLISLRPLSCSPPI